MNKPHPESLPIIAEYGIQAVSRQLTEADTLVGRGYQLAGVASVVLGLAQLSRNGPRWLLVAIIVSYILGMTACLIVVFPRKYDSPASPAQLWETNHQNPPADVWHALAYSTAQAYAGNAAVSRKRALALMVALAFLATETALAGVRLAVTV